MNKLKQNRQWLKRAIFLNMTFFPMIPFIIVVGISFYFFSSTLGKSTQASLERILTDHRKMIESFLIERKSDLELITQAYTFEDIMAELSPKGQPFLYAVSKLANQSWYLVVRQEKHDAYRGLYSAILICVIIAILGLTALVVLDYITSETICRRMDRLNEEKEQLGSQLFRAVQLAEIGEMAAGFAHEINTPLQIIKEDNLMKRMKLLLVDDETRYLETTCKRIERKGYNVWTAPSGEKALEILCSSLPMSCCCFSPAYTER